MSSLIRYEAPVATLSDIVGDLFNDGIFSRWDRGLTGTSFPNVDIVEEKETFRIKADMPGLDKKDIKVEVENGMLTIGGEKKEEKTEREKNHFYHFERTYGTFCRSFKLPDNVNTEHIDAKYNNGVLEVTLKKTEAVKPKAIEVKVE